MNVLVFDIETVPDVAAGRRLLGLHDLDDAQVAQVMLNRARQDTGSEFLRHHLHRVVAIATVLRTGDRFKVWSLGEPDSSERELLERFFDGIDRYGPTLVSWNGGGFDLPVIHYRSMLNRVVAPRYWETGDDDTSFRYNNYLNRYHARHTDLMDVLAGYTPRAWVRLDEMASLLGLPGKMGMDGARVWDAFLAGEIGAIRDYCETDVLNTYLLWLRYEMMRGRLAPDAYDIECEYVRDSLRREGRPHLDAFLRAWAQGGG
ncbi:MAG: 3'-5' exonuclease [Ectothiorhodospiraceae bacterium]|nr:3'-5' exonuclease [Chromatiales bacterium]MCP5157121.1 3'-5' exonuclease [Ectothiorhodospiraceae bacterium]